MSSKQTKKTGGIHRGSIHVFTKLIVAFDVFVVAPCVFLMVETATFIFLAADTTWSTQQHLRLITNLVMLRTVGSLLETTHRFVFVQFHGLA
jgi:hypothetical protein